MRTGGDVKRALPWRELAPDAPTRVPTSSGNRPAMVTTLRSMSSPSPRVETGRGSQAGDRAPEADLVGDLRERGVVPAPSPPVERAGGVDGHDPSHGSDVIRR